LKDTDRYDSLCLKPPPLSASSDVLFCGFTVRGELKLRFAVGFVAKNFVKACVNIRDIEEECHKFNAMFKRSDKEISRVNILIICATQYNKELESKFGGQKFFTLDNIQAWKFIDKVIVLDLTSPENRAKFFGFGHDEPSVAAIEDVISKRTKF
jgi:hypothetical protein